MSTTVIHLISAVLLWTTNICISELCEPWEAVDIPEAEIYSNGTVLDRMDGILYPPDTYWEMDLDDGPILYGCPCKLETPCLRKCCSMDKAMDYDNLTCVRHKEPWPWFHPDVKTDVKGVLPPIEKSVPLAYIFGNFCHGYLVKDVDGFHLNFTDGTLSLRESNRTDLGPKDFCLEYFPKLQIYLPYVCFEEENSECEALREILYPIEMLISVIFLLITLSVYIIIPKLRNLHGKILMCYTSSLLSAYIFLATVRILGSHISDEQCVIFGFVIYFCLLSTFFWLNILSLDICITLRSKMPSNALYQRNRKFSFCLIYGWGTPLAITMVALVMELHPDVPETYLKPAFRETCMFDSIESRLAYFIAPVSVLVLGNIILFLNTIYIIYRGGKKTAAIHNQSFKQKSNVDHSLSLKLYIKLSIVMGMIWIMEIVSTVVGGSTCIWLLSDSFNALHGLFIFFIFVCKSNVKNLLTERISRERNNSIFKISKSSITVL